MSAPDETGIPQELQLAMAMHREGRLEDAETVYREILSSSPESHFVRHPLGVLLFQTGRYDEAEKELRHALEDTGFSAPGAYHADLGNTLHRLGRLGDAEASLREAVRIDPSLAAAQSNLGVVLTEAGRVQEALGPLNKATTLAPGLVEPRVNLASALRATGDPASAEKHLREALKMDPDQPRIHAILGLALMDQGRLDEAEVSCCQALAHDLSYAKGYIDLGAVLLAQAKPGEAREAYEAAIALDPSSSEAHSSLSNALRHFGDYGGAVVAARQAVALGPDKASNHYNLGLGCWESGDFAEALSAFQRTLEIDPTLEHARFLVSALSGDPCDTAPSEYVKALFDTHADRFDANLVDELGYRIPAELRDAVWKIRGEPTDKSWVVFDVGCGTGLCGPLFRDVSARLVGGDLSPNMIEKTRERKIYDELYVEDLVATLARGDHSVDLVLATDVLIYVGNSRPTFEGARNALRPGGLFGFSTEHETGDSFSLRTSGRFSHSESYVRRLAEEFGFQVLRADKTVIRKIGVDDNRGVEGRLYVLELGT